VVDLAIWTSSLQNRLQPNDCFTGLKTVAPGFNDAGVKLRLEARGLWLVPGREHRLGVGFQIRRAATHEEADLEEELHPRNGFQFRLA
jgi:hypothetical protein